MTTPRRELCELILWHETYDANVASGDGGRMAVQKADIAVEQFRACPWSWYSPEEIIKWNGWFT